MYYQTTQLIIVSAMMPVLALIMVCLRLFDRYMVRPASRAKTSCLLSDCLIFASLLFCFALSFDAICGAVIDGVGMPLSEQTPSEFTGYLKMMFAAQFLYISAVGLVKLSVLAFDRAIFGASLRVHCDIVSGVVIAWMIAMLLGTLLQSSPISYNWDPTILDGHQGNTVFLFSFVGASNIFLDILILALPVPVICRLKRNARRKLVVVGLFLLGGFCVISSTVRLVYVIIFMGQGEGPDSYDSALAVQNLIWTIIEPSASVTAACLPTVGPMLGPLFRGEKSKVSALHSAKSPHLGYKDPTVANAGTSRPITPQESFFCSVQERSYADSAQTPLFESQCASSAGVGESGNRDLKSQERHISVINTVEVTSEQKS